MHSIMKHMYKVLTLAKLLHRKQEGQMDSIDHRTRQWDARTITHGKLETKKWINEKSEKSSHL